MKAASIALMTAAGVMVVGGAIGVLVAGRAATSSPIVSERSSPRAAEPAGEVAAVVPVDAPRSVPAPVQGQNEREAGEASTASDVTARARAAVREKPVRGEAPAAPRPVRPARELTDPTARSALALVGKHRDAEAYWFGAINNPDIPGPERSDLIEDLNEDGLSDPDNPTKEDLPLIVARIELIEKLGPYAMDHVNAAAFQEAYKDLTNMYERLTRREGGR